MAFLGGEFAIKWLTGVGGLMGGGEQRHSWPSYFSCAELEIMISVKVDGYPAGEFQAGFDEGKGETKMDDWGEMWCENGQNGGFE